MILREGYERDRKFKIELAKVRKVYVKPEPDWVPQRYGSVDRTQYPNVLLGYVSEGIYSYDFYRLEINGRIYGSFTDGTHTQFQTSWTIESIRNAARNAGLRGSSSPFVQAAQLLDAYEQRLLASARARLTPRPLEDELLALLEGPGETDPF